MSIWTKISEKCFKHLVQSTPRESAFVNYEPHSPSRTQVYTSAFFQYPNVLYDDTHTQSHSSGRIGGNLEISIMPNIQNGEDGGSI